MDFLYRGPAGEYRQHMNREGELVTVNREWHERNGTYVFAYGLGSVIFVFGVMIALHPWLPQVSTVGSFFVFGMSLVTLSFLVTTPECWVPTLGSPEHGFPLLPSRPTGRQGCHHGWSSVGHWPIRPDLICQNKFCVASELGARDYPHKSITQPKP